jgi:hypothetical protein
MANRREKNPKTPKKKTRLRVHCDKIKYLNRLITKNIYLYTIIILSFYIKLHLRLFILSRIYMYTPQVDLELISSLV